MCRLQYHPSVTFDNILCVPVGYDGFPRWLWAQVVWFLVEGAPQLPWGVSCTRTGVSLPTKAAVVGIVAVEKVASGRERSEFKSARLSQCTSRAVRPDRLAEPEITFQMRKADAIIRHVLLHTHRHTTARLKNPPSNSSPFSPVAPTRRGPQQRSKRTCVFCPFLYASLRAEITSFNFLRFARYT